MTKSLRRRAETLLGPLGYPGARLRSWLEKA